MERSALIVCKRLPGVRNFDLDVRVLVEFMRLNGRADIVDKLVVPLADWLRREFFFCVNGKVLFVLDERPLDSVT